MKYSYMINKKVFQALCGITLLLVTLVFMPNAAQAQQERLAKRIEFSASGSLPTVHLPVTLEDVLLTITGKIHCQDRDSLIKINQGSLRATLTVMGVSETTRNVRVIAHDEGITFSIDTKSIGNLRAEFPNLTSMCLFADAGNGSLDVTTDVFLIVKGEKIPVSNFFMYYRFR